MSLRLSRRTALGGVAASLAACSVSRPASYLDLPVDAVGRPPANPYRIEVARAGQALMLLGTIHSRDPTNPMFGAIEETFASFQPDAIVHENVAPAEAPDRDGAIRAAGDVGHIAFLARRADLPLISGDLAEREEFPQLARALGLDMALVFLVVQRLLVGLGGDLVAAEAEYPSFYADYLVASGLPQVSRHRVWPGFLDAFERIQGFALTPLTWDPEFTSPLVRRWPLNDASRRSHVLRDHRLIEVIRSSTSAYSRVLVVFGAWHILAIEPVARGMGLFGRRLM